MSDYDDVRFNEPDYDGLYQDLIDAPYPFKAISGGADVYVDGSQRDTIGDIAHRNGFDITDVRHVKGSSFGAKVTLTHKRLARSQSDATEESYRED